jgi:hypothetical protein
VASRGQEQDVTDFPISYDAEANALQLAGPGGTVVMLGVMLKAKFGEAFDADVLFNEPLALLMTSLREHLPPAPPWPAEFRFRPADVFMLAERIVEDSVRSGWWAMSEAERSSYVQNVVVAPYRLPADQLRDLLDEVEAGLLRRQLIVRAAERATSS